MAYKLVLNKNNELISLVDSRKHKLVYKVGEWIAGIYPVFIFKKLNDAREFKKEIIKLGRVEIWECNARNIREIGNVSQSMESIDNFWRVGYWTDKKYASPELMSAPPGTHVADKVKFKKKVE